jgi:hypothetical protein
MAGTYTENLYKTTESLVERDGKGLSIDQAHHEHSRI